MNKNLDNVADGSGRFSVVNGAGLKAVSSVDGANKALIDFSQGGHTNKNLDNVGDGSTYARPLSSALSSGLVKSAHISNQTVGQLSLATLCSAAGGGVNFSGWKNVATATVNIPSGTASIKLHVNVPAQITGGTHTGVSGVGFAIYSGADPGSPQAFVTNADGAGQNTDVTLSSPTTGNGLTLALYIQGGGTTNWSVLPAASLTQTVAFTLNAGALT